MSKSNVVSQNTALIQGLQRDFSNRTFELDGQVWKTVDLVAAFSDENSLFTAAANAHGAWKTAVASQRAKTVSNRKLRVALHAALKQTLGANSPKLASDFGYAQHVRKVPSQLTGAIAAAKRAATRLARGTKGQRQLKAIHGVSPTIVISPSATATSPVTHASAAPSGEAPTPAPTGTAQK